MRRMILALALTGIVSLGAFMATHESRAQAPAPPASGVVTNDDRALAQFYRDAIKTQDQDRTQEILALFTDGSPEAKAWSGTPDALTGSNKIIQALAGEIPASPKDLDQARLVLTRMKSYIENSRKVPKGQVYAIHALPPELTLEQWAAGVLKPKTGAMEMNIPFPKTSPQSPSPGSCVMAWSPQALFLKYDVVDPTPSSKNLERDSGIYDDDCVELFFVAKPSPAEYWELNIGRNSGIRDVFITKTPGKWFGKVSNEATLKGLEFAITPITVDGKPKGYTVVAKVPWVDLLGAGAAPKTGDKFPFAVGFSDTFVKPDGSPGQTYYSSIYTFVGYHDVARYDTLVLAQ